MARMITAYVVTAIVFLGIDYLWLSRVAKSFYFDRLGDMVLDKPKMGAAALFYAVYVIGIVIFAVAPALKGPGGATTAALYGALFGFFAYATYDMTNYATLKNWPVAITVVDIAWGTVLTGVSALAGYLITRAIFPA